MRILVCCRAIDNMAGGIEKMATSLMNEMTGRGHEMALMSWDHEGAQSFYPLDTQVKWYKVGVGDASRKASLSEKLQRASRVRAIVREFQPDLMVGFHDGPFLAARIYTLGMFVPVILAERNAPTRHKYENPDRKTGLLFNLYRLARRITVQCESYVDEYPEYLREKITVIPNPVFPVKAINKIESGHKNLLSIGRLEFQKNYSVLVEAFALLADQYPDWRLVIVGDGSEKQKLQNLIQDKGLEGRASILPPQKDLSGFYAQADIFCLPSRWEGFPNVLAEAMAYGVPACGFEECAGVRDLIKQEETGLLAQGAEDPQELAKALNALMSGLYNPLRMGAAAKRAVEQYDPEVVYNQWEKFFKDSIKV